ncbi:UNVERIFIED_CONTAM: hypothetical protein Sradi_3267100 [Sesamum radiatum]|uniref:Uncharacterized protein n=1 Tax=Sesamum radiatum TaxID=300843 RepID=A0AAW2R0Y6_SESRA
MKVAKKEAVARYQKAEKEVKRLQREAKALQEEHAEELRPRGIKYAGSSLRLRRERISWKLVGLAVWQSTRSLTLIRRRLL